MPSREVEIVHDHIGRLAAENDRLRAALEDIRDGLAPYRERLSSQQAKNAYDIAALALDDQHEAIATTSKEKNDA
jgi:hypothetical protein